MLDLFCWIILSYALYGYIHHKHIYTYNTYTHTSCQQPSFSCLLTPKKTRPTRFLFFFNVSYGDFSPLRCQESCQVVDAHRRCWWVACLVGSASGVWLMTWLLVATFVVHGCFGHIFLMCSKRVDLFNVLTKGGFNFNKKTAALNWSHGEVFQNLNEITMNLKWNNWRICLGPLALGCSSCKDLHMFSLPCLSLAKFEVFPFGFRWTVPASKSACGLLELCMGSLRAEESLVAQPGHDYGDHGDKMAQRVVWVVATQIFLMFTPILGVSWSPIWLVHIFQRGWKKQPVLVVFACFFWTGGLEYVFECYAPVLWRRVGNRPFPWDENPVDYYTLPSVIFYGHRKTWIQDLYNETRISWNVTRVFVTAHGGLFPRRWVASISTGSDLPEHRLISCWTVSKQVGTVDNVDSGNIWTYAHDGLDDFDFVHVWEHLCYVFQKKVIFKLANNVQS